VAKGHSKIVTTSGALKAQLVERVEESCLESKAEIEIIHRGERSTSRDTSTAMKQHETE